VIRDGIKSFVSDWTTNKTLLSSSLCFDRINLKCIYSSSVKKNQMDYFLLRCTISFRNFWLSGLFVADHFLLCSSGLYHLAWLTVTILIWIFCSYPLFHTCVFLLRSPIFVQLWFKCWKLKYLLNRAKLWIPTELLVEGHYNLASNFTLFCLYSQSDYLRKISLKLLSMETKAQQAPGNAQLNPNQNNPS
jgi:hypothetical protein